MTFDHTKYEKWDGWLSTSMFGDKWFSTRFGDRGNSNPWTRQAGKVLQAMKRRNLVLSRNDDGWRTLWKWVGEKEKNSE